MHTHMCRRKWDDAKQSGRSCWSCCESYLTKAQTHRHTDTQTDGWDDEKREAIRNIDKPCNWPLLTRPHTQRILGDSLRSLDLAARTFSALQVHARAHAHTHTHTQMLKSCSISSSYYSCYHPFSNHIFACLSKISSRSVCIFSGFCKDKRCYGPLERGEKIKKGSRGYEVLMIVVSVGSGTLYR